MQSKFIILIVLLAPYFVNAQEGEWIPLNDGLQNRTVHTITDHPNDPDVLYAGIDNGLYISTNRGERWQQAYGNLPVRSIWVSDDGRTIMIACGGGSRSDGIWISNDGGNNFQVFRWFFMASAIAVDPDDPQRIFCGSLERGFIYTLNGGQQWIEANNGLRSNCIFHLTIKNLEDETYLFASTDRGLFRCVLNNNLQWQELGPGLPVEQSAISFENDEGIFAGTGDETDSDGLYYSNNLGNEWEVARWAHYVQAVETMPELVVMASTEIGVNRSNDGGENWTEMNEELDDYDINDLLLQVTDDQIICYCAHDGDGVFRYAIQAGEQERDLTVQFAEGWNLISINLIPPEAFWIRDEGPDVVRMIEQLRIDEDHHHILLFKNVSGNFCVPDRGFNNIPYWDLTNGYLAKVDDDVEAVWTGMSIPADEDIPLRAGWNIAAYYPEYELDAGSPQFYVLSPIIDNVLLAKDGGGDFMSPRHNFSNMQPWRETQGYQVKMEEDDVLNYPPEQDDVDFIPDALINRLPAYRYWQPPVPTGRNMSVLVTTITGVESDVGDQAAAFTDDGRIVGVGSVDNEARCGLAVWGDDPTTENRDGMVEGESFELRLWNCQTKTETRLNPERFLTGSGLVYQADDFIVMEVSTDIAIPDSYSITRVYPNPFNSATTVTYHLPVESCVSLKVYNLSGRILETLEDGHRRAGIHSTNLNAGDLTSGLYFIRLEADKRTLTSKIFLIK